MSTDQTMTPTAYAARLGLSLQAVRDAAKAHGLPWQPGQKAVPVAEMDAAWADLYRTGAVKTPAPGQAETDIETDDDNLAEAKRRKAWADAELAELRLARARDEVVSVTEVTETWTRITAGFDAMLEALPARLAPLLPGEPRTTMTITRDVIRDMRSALVEQVEAEAIEAEAARTTDVDTVEPETPVAPPAPSREGPKKRKGKVSS